MFFFKSLKRIRMNWFSWKYLCVCVFDIFRTSIFFLNLVWWSFELTTTQEDQIWRRRQQQQNVMKTIRIPHFPRGHQRDTQDTHFLLVTITTRQKVACRMNRTRVTRCHLFLPAPHLPPPPPPHFYLKIFFFLFLNHDKLKRDFVIFVILKITKFNFWREESSDVRSGADFQRGDEERREDAALYYYWSGARVHTHARGGAMESKGGGWRCIVHKLFFFYLLGVANFSFKKKTTTKTSETRDSL